MATITKELWGKSKDGKEIYLYTLTNESGACIKVSSVGAGLVAACVPDRKGNLADVVLGYPLQVISQTVPAREKCRDVLPTA